MPLGSRQLAILRRTAEALLPPGGALGPGAADTDVGGRLASFVGGLPAWQARAMGAMLIAWELSPLFSSYRRTFERLSPGERQAYLEACLRGRRGPRRALALWLKSLCLMAYCSHPLVEEAVGFTGSCLEEGAAPEGPRLEPIAYPHIRGRMEERTDVCVVGSGAGGAVVAKELAEGGLSVIVLEEGAYFRRPDFRGSPWERMQTLYRNRGLTAAFGRSVVPIPLGKCVGGTTVVNSGTCFRTPERVLRRWEAAGIEGVDPVGMEPIFRRVEEELSVQPVPREIIGRNALTFQRGVEALGLHGRPIQRAIRGCRGCGVCAFGCPSDAKQAMHISYLPKAAAHGARVFAGCRADHILMESGRAIGVEADILDPATEQVRGRLRVCSQVVVLAAGAIHTPALLMRNGLTARPVGRNLSIHPAIGVGALFDEEVFGWRGTMQSYYVDDLHESLGVLLEVTSPLPGVGAVSLPGGGLALKQALASYKHLASVGLFVSDSATGRVVGNRWWSEPVAFYSLSRKDAARLQRGMALAAEVFLEAGARTVYTGLARLPTVASRRDLERLRDAAIRPEELTVMGFHPMGTCRMGRDPATSVVGPYGESHAVRGLFLADASVLPSCAGVNPQVTIMALATRTAFHLREQGVT